MQLSQFIRQIMKKILTNILLCSFVLLCSACFEEVDLGYPYHVIFPKEGGEQIITGIIKPQVNYNGKMIQAAQITVSQNI